VDNFCCQGGIRPPSTPERPATSTTAPAGSARAWSAATLARTGTDRDGFEIIYAGGAGAMQTFGRRIDQDQILQLLAYFEVLREQAE